MADAPSLCCIEWDSSKPKEVLWRSRGEGGSRIYKVDLGLFLQRAAKLGLQVKRVAVDSSRTRKLPLSERTLKLKGNVPGDALRPNGVIQLSRLQPGQADALRARLGSLAAKVGRAPGARGGGNTTKSLRFYFTRGLKRGEVLKLDAPPGEGELVRAKNPGEIANVKGRCLAW